MSGSLSTNVRPVGDNRPIPLARLGAIGALALSVGTGIALVEQPVFAALPIAALVGAALLVDGRARLTLVIFGGMFLLQRSPGLGASKIALLGAFSAAFVGALFNTRKLRGTPQYQVAAPLLSLSAVLAAVVGFSMFTAHLRGTPSSDILRDATPYLLFAATPVFALDAQAVLSRRWLMRLLVIAGTLGATSFAVVWLQRRGLAYLPLARLGVASLFVPAALFALAMATALQARRRRLRWLILAGFLLALLVTTGTRSSLALFVAPFAIAVARRRGLAMRTFRLAVLAPLAACLTLLFALAVVEFTSTDTAFLQKRISLLTSSGNSNADASYNDRLNETRSAWSAFRSSPVFGVGPGYLFEYTPQGSRVPTASFQLDTPLTFLAKFGIVGLALLPLVVSRFWVFLRGVRRLRPGIPYLALAGYLSVVVALSVFAPPFEDKGFSFGLILALALALQPMSYARRNTPEMTH